MHLKAIFIFWLAVGLFAHPQEPLRAPLHGITERHNFWRQQVGQPPLIWSEELATEAQAWADELAKRGCEMEHRPHTGKWGTVHGENIFWAYNMDVNPKTVVDSWADERKFYQPATGKCKGGVCGHYTQIVWKDTRQVGCGMAKCGAEEIWVCNYDPPGNYVGEKAY